MRPIAAAATLLAIAVFACPDPASARVINPPPNAPMLTSCTGLTGAAAASCAAIDEMNPTQNWPANIHVNMLAGTADRAAGAVAATTHGGAFAAAAAQQIGVYLLRPPQAPQAGLENAQFVWLWNQAVANPTAFASGATAPRAGWSIIGTSASSDATTAAQTLANQGYPVLAASPALVDTATCQSGYFTYLAGLTTAAAQAPYRSATTALTYSPPAGVCATTGSGTGQIAVVRPNLTYLQSGLVKSYGPVVAQAGTPNANGITASDAFGASYKNGQVYFFVSGGPTLATQSAYAGYYATSAAADHHYGVQRTPDGMTAAGIFTYDSNGSPVWYYGEAALNPAVTAPPTALVPAVMSGASPSALQRSWISTPAGTPPAGSLDLPFAWKPFFQPAATGTNLYDPDGGPVAYQQVGQWNLNFAPFDNSTFTVNLAISDPGTVPTAGGAVPVTGTASLNVQNEAPTRLPAAGATTIQVAAANAPAAGWWWAAYSQSGWSQTTTGFKTLGMFLDIQGTSVAGTVVGAIPSPASNLTSAPPYRPYWLYFSGTVQNNGQIEGTYYACTRSGNNNACTPYSGTGTFALNADGTAGLTIGGASIALNRYSTLPAIPQRQGVPVIFEPAYNDPTLSWGNMVQVAVGTATPLVVTFDLGSSGMFIDPAQLTPGTYTVAANQPTPGVGPCGNYASSGLCQGYSSGVLYVAQLAYANFTIGGVTVQNLPFGLVTQVECDVTLNANCANPAEAAKLKAKTFTGRAGTMGVVQSTTASNPTMTGVITSPLVQLPLPYGGGFTLSLKNLAVNLGLPQAVRDGFNSIQMAALAPQAGCVGAGGSSTCPPAWNNATATATLSTGNGIFISTLPTIFDSGAGNIRISLTPCTAPNQAIAQNLSTTGWIWGLNTTACAVQSSNGLYSLNTGPGVAFTVTMSGPTIGNPAQTTTMLNNLSFPLAGNEWTGQGNLSIAWQSTNPNYANSNLGSPALQAIDVLWDGQNGYLGARPAQ